MSQIFQRTHRLVKALNTVSLNRIRVITLNSESHLSTSAVKQFQLNRVNYSKPEYKLIYFDLRAIAEPIRLIFAYANVPYIDQRVSFKEWSTIKPNTPMGTLPVLLVDGKELTQSSTVTRYVGRKFGLVPKDDFDSARCDEVVDMLHDIMYLWRPFRREQDADKQAKLKTDLLTGIVSKSLKRFETFVAANENKHVAGNTTSWADLVLASYLDMFELTLDKDMLVGYPGLKQFKEHILGLPEIQKWMESRPPFKVA